MRGKGALLFFMALGAAVPAHAQSVEGGPSASPLSITFSAASEERRRGLSWSDGDPVVGAALSVPVTDALTIDAAVTSLSNSARHGGADAAIEMGAGYATQAGAWRLSAQAKYLAFPGASDQGYAEIGAGAGVLIGPAAIDFSADYAPRQSAIGGDNLSLATVASLGVPGTPFTVWARLGHHSGSVRDPLRAQRLRPDGSYWDHGAGVDWVQGRWSAGLRYSNSSIDGPGSRHAGAAVIGRLAVRL